MGCIIPGNNGFFKELASLVLQTEAINCPEKYIPLGPEWILPLFDTAHIENSYLKKGSGLHFEEDQPSVKSTYQLLE